MADFNLTMELRVKADQAKAALTGVKTDLAGVGTAAKEASIDGAKVGPALQQGAVAATGAVAQMESELAALRSQLLAVTAAETSAGQQAAELGAKIQALEAKLGKGGRGGGGSGASGSVGNLVAQFNDIGMMMAAGQNPLQLAIQQGSQITQSFGAAGASGAVKMLGAAFLQMLNPVNLVTYAAIAAGAAFVQWLFSSEEAALTLDEAVGELEASVKRLAETGGKDLKQVKEDFGAITPEVAKLRGEISTLANVQVIIAMKDAFRALKDEVEGDWLNTDAGQVADLLNVRWQRFEDGAPKIGINPVIREFQASLEKLQDTRGPTEQLAVIRQINEQFVTSTGGIENMTTAQMEYYGKILATEEALRQMVIVQAEAATKAREIARQAALAQNDRLSDRGGPQTQDSASLERRAAESREMRAMVQDLQQQAEIQFLINKYGEDSVQVAKARAAAEREVFVEMTRASAASKDLQDQVIAAYDAAAKLEAWDMATPLEKATAVATVLGNALGVSLSDAQAAMASLVASAPGGGWLSGAIGDVALLATTAWDAARAMAAARGGAIVNANPTKGPGFESGGRSGSTLAPYIPPALTLEGIIARDAKKGGSGAGGGGGGALDAGSFNALVAAAEKAMATLEAAIAAINEKVALGLMTTAEGTKAIAQAKEQAGNSIAELIPKLEKANDVAGTKAAAAVAKWRAEVKGLVVDLGMAGSEMSEKLSDNFEKGFAAFLTGAKSGKAAMSDFKNFILQQMAEIAAQKFTSNIISPLIDSLLGGVFGGGASSGGTGSFGLPAPFAMGGIPGGPGIAAYSGSIVDRPTFFPMAKGAYGLMGEAGPEAVVPLARGADGKLGVRNNGGGGSTPVVVNVINNAQGTKATESQRTEGGINIVDVVIEQVEAAIAGNITQGRGLVPDALSGTYGLSRIGS